MTGWLILGPGILEFVYVGFTRATLLDNSVRNILSLSRSRTSWWRLPSVCGA
jgi:hypothetical protein